MFLATTLVHKQTNEPVFDRIHFSIKILRQSYALLITFISPLHFQYRKTKEKDISWSIASKNLLLYGKFIVYIETSNPCKGLVARYWFCGLLVQIVDSSQTCQLTMMQAKSLAGHTLSVKALELIESLEGKVSMIQYLLFFWLCMGLNREAIHRKIIMMPGLCGTFMFCNHAQLDCMLVHFINGRIYAERGCF